MRTPRGNGALVVVASLLAVAALSGWLASATPPVFSSLSPDGGERLVGGSTFDVAWTVTHENDTFAYTTIRYSLDGGSTYPYFVTADPFATGGSNHPWRVPAWNASTARVRVCATAPDGSATCTESAGDFTILASTQTIALLSPSDYARNVPLLEPIVIGFDPPPDTSNVSWTVTPTFPFVPSWSPNNRMLTLTPTMPMPECTMFGLAVSAGDGRFHTSTFETLCPAPGILATSPANASVDVALLEPVVVQFRGPMNPASVVLTATPTIAFTATWSQNYSVATYDHVEPFAACTMYTVGVSGSDPYGNPLSMTTPPDPGFMPNPWSFLTGCPTQGYVQLLSPVGGEDWTGGSVHDILWWQSDPTGGAAPWELLWTMDAGATWQTIANGTSGNGTMSYPWTVPLVDTTSAQVEVCTAISGAPTCDVSGPFTIDSTPPMISAHDPAEGQADVALDSPIVVTFSEPMNRSGTEAGFFLTPTVPVLAFEWGANDTLLTVRPGTLEPATTYAWGFSCSARDVSVPGNPLADCQSVYTFTTRDSSSIRILSPVGGESWTGGSDHSVTFTITNGGNATETYVVNATYRYANGVLSGTIGSQSVAVPAKSTLPGTFPWAVPTIDAVDVLVVLTAEGGISTLTAQSGPFEIDSTAPALITSFPSDGASGAKTTQDVWFVWSERVDRASFEASFSLSPDPGGVLFSWSLTNLGTDLLVVEHRPFKSNTAYTATFDTTAKDDSDPGNPLGASVVVRFATQPPPDVTPPVAKAVGKNQVQVGEPVTLDGTQSTGNITLYVWRIVDNQNRFVAVLLGSTATYTFQENGRYAVALIVTDSNGLMDEDTIEIAVTSNPNAGLILAGGISFVAALGAATEVGKYGLFGWVLFPLYARRRRNELLEHETRGMIFGYVLVHPGDTYTDIKRNLQLTNGTLSYHLRVLEREGLIRSRTQGVRKHFYSVGTRPPEDGGGLHEVQIRMLRAVREVPGLAVRDLAGALDITSQHALYHLRALASGGFVRLERRGLRLRCYPADPRRGPGEA